MLNDNNQQNFDSTNLSDDLAQLVKIGLVDIHIGDDGQWLYSANPILATLTEDQVKLKISSIKDV